MSDGGRLVVLVDGRALDQDEARAVWTRFSRWMDEHPGDMDGFARSEGHASARPETHGGKAVLVLSSAQGPALRQSPPRRGRSERRGRSR